MRIIKLGSESFYKVKCTDCAHINYIDTSGKGSSSFTCGRCLLVQEKPNIYAAYGGTKFNKKEEVRSK